jgi:hypothetical protein
MRTLFATLFCFLLCAGSAFAQTIPAGRAGAVDTSLGLSWISHPDSGSGRVDLNAADTSFTVTLNSRIGVTANLGYAFASHLFGTPERSAVLSYLGGPVLYLTNPRRKVRTDVHLLLGGARVSGPVPVGQGFLVGSWETGFAWSMGGGVVYQFSNRFALRTGVDLLRTQYIGPSLTSQGQSNIRATAALVYLFGAPQLRRRR